MLLWPPDSLCPVFFRPPTPPPGLVLTLVNRTKWNVSACCEVKTGLKEKKGDAEVPRRERNANGGDKEEIQ